MSSKYAELRNDYFNEEEGLFYIDVWFTNSDNEEGTVIAKVNPATKQVEYLDEEARTDEYAQGVIQELLEADIEEDDSKENEIDRDILKCLVISAIEWSVNVSKQIIYDLLRGMGITSDMLEAIEYDKENYPDMHKWVEDFISD